MLSETKRLRELAKLHRELADVVSLGRTQRLALADELDRRADQLEGTVELGQSLDNQIMSRRSKPSTRYN